MRGEGIEAEAVRVLTALAGQGVRCVVVGSLARRWLSPDAAPAPRDVDVLVPGDAASLDRLVGSLLALGFEVFSWTDPVRPPVDPDLLRGRYYLRAVREDRRGRLVVDATYESPLLSFDEAWAHRRERGDVAVACPEDLERFRWPRGQA
jgi:hypothetical protein